MRSWSRQNLARSRVWLHSSLRQYHCPEITNFLLPHQGEWESYFCCIVGCFSPCLWFHGCHNIDLNLDTSWQNTCFWFLLRHHLVLYRSWTILWVSCMGTSTSAEFPATLFCMLCCFLVSFCSVYFNMRQRSLCIYKSPLIPAFAESLPSSEVSWLTLCFCKEHTVIRHSNHQTRSQASSWGGSFYLNKVAVIRIWTHWQLMDTQSFSGFYNLWFPPNGSFLIFPAWHWDDFFFFFFLTTYLLKHADSWLFFCFHYTSMCFNEDHDCLIWVQLTVCSSFLTII